MLQLIAVPALYALFLSIQMLIDRATGWQFLEMFMDPDKKD